MKIHWKNRKINKEKPLGTVTMGNCSSVLLGFFRESLRAVFLMIEEVEGN